MAAIDEFLEQQATKFEEDLCELLRIPSVSTDSRHNEDVGRAADWLTDHFRGIGLDAERIDTAGHPLVYAQWIGDPKGPTALVYGHYDVQPPDPIDEWKSPPFEPTRRNGDLFARGATDDKGQMLTHVKSTQAWMATEGRLPLNVKFLIEGEEEVGSENLDKFIDEHGDRLACDVVVISDTCQFGPGQPAITYGLKGITYFQLELQGPRQDLHSGSFGGAVANPANALVQMLASLIDDRGKIQLPGFYDDVVPLAENEREDFQSLPFNEEAFMAKIGVDALSGEQGYSTLERRWARPTFDINGLWGGYQGEGAKTVLPARAGAKFSFRLVPHQDPAKVTAALTEMLEEICPPGIKMKLESFHGAPGVVVPLDSPYIKAAAQAIEKGFGRSPVFIREGGSIPVVSTFHEKLQVDTLLLGWGLSDDNAHSPNEKFCLADFHRGIRSSAYLWKELSMVASSIT